jgi:hypothetical protein
VIENMRGRSTETKYGRIPLWLYETGVGLQAIATYGWLHGRYGHYERVMPSYATLARELGVSRGSVIAYVKVLVSVGAVRIETSGAAGQQTNQYAIAFNEPFEVASELDRGGQNADHPVSGLYRTGQNADPGGQRAVHEEDVLKKTKKTLSPRAVPNLPQQPPAAPKAEREIPAAPSNDDAVVTAAWAAARGGRRNPAAERDIAASARQLLAAAWPLADVVALAEDMARRQPTYRDLTRHADHWQPPQPAAASAGSGLPPWCGKCADDGLNTAARGNIKLRTLGTAGTGELCPRCHPDAMTVAA